MAMKKTPFEKLRTRIEREIKTCRYLGDIQIDPVDYLRLKDYLKAFCQKTMLVGGIQRANAIFAVTLVQIGIIDYEIPEEMLKECYIFKKTIPEKNAA